MTPSAIARALLAIAFLSLSPPVLAQDGDANASVSGEHDFNMYCASCHGEDGKGDGPKAFGLSVAPPDLTTLAERYGSFPRDRLERLIDGREPLPGHGDREMPVWGMWFKEEAAAGLGGAEGDDRSVRRRIDKLVGYIETLQR
jgi:mono/diheme cytochrome c family protein